MMGTLAGALEVRGLTIPPDAIHASVEGFNEVRDRIPVLTRIAVHYTLRIPTGSRAVADRALETHQAKCPTANSLRGTVEISWTADVTESDA